MPVEDVVLVHLHQVQIVLDDRLGDVMSTCVYQDASVGESWGIHDLCSINDILKMKVN